MDFVSVEGRALLPVLKLAGDIVERRSSIPILSCVRLSLDGAVLRVEATDLDMVIRADVEISDGAGAWSVCLPAAVLAGIARVAGPMPVRIEPGDKVIVTLGNGEAIYTLDPLPAADFPDLLTETGGGDRAVRQRLADGSDGPGLDVHLDRGDPILSERRRLADRRLRAPVRRDGRA